MRHGGAQSITIRTGAETAGDSTQFGTPEAGAGPAVDRIGRAARANGLHLVVGEDEESGAAPYLFVASGGSGSECSAESPCAFSNAGHLDIANSTVVLPEAVRKSIPPDAATNTTNGTGERFTRFKPTVDEDGYLHFDFYNGAVSTGTSPTASTISGIRTIVPISPV